jgi:hypothetical protein
MIGKAPRYHHDLTIVGEMSFRGLILNNLMIRRALPCVSFEDVKIIDVISEMSELGILSSRISRDYYDTWQFFHCGARIVNQSPDDKIWNILG